MFIVRNKKIFTLISLALVLLSLASIAVFGLKKGIEFEGGTIVEISYPVSAPNIEAVNELLETRFPGSLAQPTDEGFIIRTKFLEDKERGELIQALSFNGTRELVEERVSSVGPSIGSELKTKAAYAIGGIILLTIMFIAFAFRKVSEPVSSWWYGVIAIVTLLHDIIIPAGVYAFLGSMYGWEVDVLFVTALLAIFGLSINDTIVVFDRIRENLEKNKEAEEKKDFETVVGESVSETYTRSINTSLMTVFTLVSLFFFGSETTRHFALVLLIGMLVGAYSSVFLASPLLVFVEKLRGKKKEV